VVTDTRLPERFITDRRIRRLTDAAHRLYVNAMVWSVANRTDGVIYDDDLALIPDIDRDRADELIKAELWRRDRDRWLIVDYAATQTSKHELEVLENVRRRDREKKARQRAAAAADGDSPGDSPGVRSPGTAQEGRKAGSEVQDHAGTSANGAARTCEQCGQTSSFTLIEGLCRRCRFSGLETA
jgi:hypothetical protein